MANSLDSSTRSRNRESESVARCSTPTQNKNYDLIDRDYSPVFLPCTQESLEDVDVLWDWNSPQSKINYAFKKKRLCKAPSPKLPLKKSNSNNQLKTFEKLKEELRAFTRITKNSGKQVDYGEEDLFDDNRNELDDVFNDSIDQELLMVSQQIEDKFVGGNGVCKKLELNSPLNSKGRGSELNSPLNSRGRSSELNSPLKSRGRNSELNSPLNLKGRNSPRNPLTKSYSSNMLESPIKRFETRANPTNFKKKMQQLNGDFDDSLDITLRDVDLSDLVNEPKEKHANTSAVMKLKTKSLSFGDHYDNTRVNVQKDADARLKAQIEMKRLEALAKLRSKKKQELSDSDTSPIKCSPEEIEMKRLQALAKLEAKKKQEAIERNRLQALKRLEMNRKKRAETTPSLSLRNNGR